MRNYDLAKQHMAHSQHQAEVQRLRDTVKNDKSSRQFGMRLRAQLQRFDLSSVETSQATQTLKPSRNL